MKKVKFTRLATVEHSSEIPVYPVFATVDDWLDVERNPRQRCEKKKANQPHLATLALSHYEVHMAVLPDNSIVKLNGHTRAYKWRIGTLERPDYLVVNVFSVADMAEAKRLYDHFDSKSAVKTPVHAMQSGINEHEIRLTTRWLRNGEFSAMLTDAMEIAHLSPKKLLPVDRVKGFKSELELFDKVVGLSKKQFPMGFGTSALLMLRKHGLKVLPFLQSFNDKTGVDHYGKRDAVRMALDYLNAERSSSGGMAGKKVNRAQTAMMLAFADRFLDGNKLLEKNPSPVDLATYLPTPAVVAPKRRGKTKSTGLVERARAAKQAANP